MPIGSLQEGGVYEGAEKTGAYAVIFKATNIKSIAGNEDLYLEVRSTGAPGTDVEWDQIMQMVVDKVDADPDWVFVGAYKNTGGTRPITPTEVP